MNFVAACLVIGIEPFNLITVQHIAQDHAAINGHIGQRFKLKQIGQIALWLIRAGTTINRFSVRMPKCPSR